MEVNDKLSFQAFLPILSSSHLTQLYLHQPTTTIADLSIVPFDSSIALQSQTIEWRAKTQYPIMRILGIEKENQLERIRIYKEGIKVFVKNLSSLALPQCLYIFKSTIFGMQKLVERFGFFLVTANLIGITYENQCKIWIHESIEKNQKMGLSYSQSEMLNQLLKILYFRAEATKKSQIFFQKAFRICHTFAQALSFINVFTYEEEILIPPYFTEVFKIVHRPSVKIEEECSAEIKSEVSQFFSRESSKKNSVRINPQHFSKLKEKFNKSHSTYDNSVHSQSMMKTNTKFVQNQKNLLKNRIYHEPLSFGKHHKPKLRHMRKKSSPERFSKPPNEMKMRKFIQEKVVKYIKFYEQFRSSKTIEGNTEESFYEQLSESLGNVEKLSKLGRAVADSIVETEENS